MDLRRVALQVLLSTDRSLAESIREALLSKFLRLFPSGYFEDKLYDTGEGGKGWRPGYVSFGLKPMVWSGKGLIGGVLVRGTYSPKTVRSESPEPGTPEWKEWEKAGGSALLEGGEVETMQLVAGYYNKKAGGEFSRQQDLGEATFAIDKLEQVQELELGNPDAMKAAVEALVDDVLKNPPAEAMGARHRQMQQNQYTSRRRFLNYLAEEGRNSFRMDEVRLLAQNTGQRENDILDWLRQRGLNLERPMAASRYPSW